MQFLANIHTVSNRNRPAKQVGGQRWMNQHSLNRGSTRPIQVLCAVSASPECLMNHGELRRLRTGSPAHCSRPSGPDFYLRSNGGPGARTAPQLRVLRQEFAAGISRSGYLHVRVHILSRLRSVQTGRLCPNCGGNLVARPVRPVSKLKTNPASTVRVFKPNGCSQPAHR